MALRALLLLLLAAASAQTIPSKPNVLFILVDDLGHAELGYKSAPPPTAHRHPNAITAIHAHPVPHNTYDFTFLAATTVRPDTRRSRRHRSTPWSPKGSICKNL